MRAYHAYGITDAEVAPQALLVHMRIPADQMIGGLEDAARGAEILLELYHFQRRKILTELLKVFRLCAAPRIDGLIVVADDREPRP